MGGFANTEHYCNVCDTLSRRDIDGYKIKINEPEDYDIFIPFEIKQVLVSQKIVDWCLEKGITNAKAKFTRTEDHISPMFNESIKEQIDTTNKDLQERIKKFNEY